MGKRRANGEGSIYQRKSDGRWAASLSIGKTRRKHFLGYSRAEVAAKLTAAMNDQQTGVPVTSSRLNVSQYLTQWLDAVKSGVRPRTHESYELNVRRLTPLIGKTKLTSLTPTKVEQAYADLLARGLSARSVNQAHTVLHGALEKAVKWGHIGRNPADAVTPPRVLRSEMKTLTEEQVRFLFEGTADDRLHALWVLLATTGLRLGEAGGLKWSDVDLERETLTIRRALQRQKEAGLVFVEPKTKSSRRTVHLPTGTAVSLRGHRRRQIEERLQAGSHWKDLDLVFSRWDGGPLEPSGVVQRFHGLLNKLGLPQVRVHDLRHTAATLHLSKGTHPKIVQEMLGHSTITLTLDTYSHVAPGIQAEAAKKLDSLFAAERVTAAGASNQP